ncbi:glycosyltransferase [Flavobacterium sp.]|uniref:glycosyltransferase n=1 Tax=Flavobacterium sp. TaxID=239 RepID=UPI003D1507D8
MIKEKEAYNNSNIMVSIFILTYNQEHYIAQTIESILNQKTNFSFQLVIGEDCSSDRTRAVCEKFAGNYGNKIKLLPSPEKNIGLIANYIRTIKECDGRYIAICDGDDYWIDPLKLQKQVDFLENNLDYSIVHTALKFLYPNGDLDVFSAPDNLYYNEFKDLIYSNFIFSVTVLFRNIQFNEPLPQWLEQYSYGDWPTYLWTIKDGGKIHYIEDITAVYRKNIGISYKLKDWYSDDLNIRKNILSDVHFNKHTEIISKCIFEKECGLFLAYNRDKKLKEAFKLFIQLLKKEKGKLSLTKLYLHSLKKAF